MKKSEMVEKIRKRLSECGEDVESNTIHRIIFLAWMEGMEPPVLRRVTTGYEDGVQFKLALFPREWEPENSVTETEPDVTETEGN